jgi:DNA-binding CsgD family transcriptional regulator
MGASQLAAKLRALGRSGASQALVLTETAKLLETELHVAQAVIVRMDPETGAFGGHFQRSFTAEDVARSEAYVRDRIDQPDARTRGLKRAISAKRPELWTRNSREPGWGLFELDEYADLYRKKGIGQLLSVMLATPAGGGGYVCLYRAAGEGAFSRDEEKTVEAIRAPLIHLYDALLAERAIYNEQDERTAVFVRPDGGLEATSRGANLLGLLGGGGRDGEAKGKDILSGVLSKLNRLGERDVLPSTRIVNTFGEFRLRADFLPSGAVVEIERFLPKPVLVLRGADRFDLSGRQIELVSELASGQTLQQAGEALGVSRSTARYFLDEIFAKTATGDQAAALAALAEAGRAA